jgi:hypothetical protein
VFHPPAPVSRSPVDSLPAPMNRGIG